MGSPQAVMIEPIEYVKLYTELFATLDLDKQEYVHSKDMYLVCKGFGWSKSKVDNLINDLDPNHSDVYNI
jgi:Ca2+-binding EF-hand superfamily protein